VKYVVIRPVAAERPDPAEPSWGETEILPGLSCPQCDRPLVPAPLDGSLAFRCYQGHVYPPAELFRSHPEPFQRGLEMLLASREEMLWELLQTVVHARNHGYFRVVEIFSRRILPLRAEIKALRVALISGT
jgi:hypothetical protein